MTLRSLLPPAVLLGASLVALLIGVALMPAPPAPPAPSPPPPTPAPTDPCQAADGWDAIRSSAELRVALPNDSTTYFLFRGAPRGFEYELLRDFAKRHRLELVISRENDATARLRAVQEGAVHVAGGRTPVRTHDEIAWSHPLYETSPAVVQRLAGARNAVPPELRGAFEELITTGTRLAAHSITSPEGLIGEEVWLTEGGGWLEDLIELEHEERGDIDVVSVSGAHTETLVRWVSAQRIPLAVAGSNVSELASSYYADVVVRPALGPDRPVALATHCSQNGLLSALDAFIEANPGRIDALYQRYFLDRAGYEERAEEETLFAGRVSVYDDLLRRYAATIDWDWRLLAAQAYQESRFRPRARSWAGAVGLMQLMPAAARQVGVTDRRDPEQSIRGGVAYLAWLEDIWDDHIEDPDERLKFVLASYNAGAGHVGDARRLAAAFGDDESRWAEVVPWLIRLSERHWYTQPSVRYGFCRGLEPALYVEKILRRHARYRDLVPELPYRGDPDEELLEAARSLRGFRTELAPELAELDPSDPPAPGRRR